MKLQGEDIDGLAVLDGGVVGQFDAGDVIYVSLAGSSLRLAYCGGPPGSSGADCVIQIEPTRGPGLNPPGRAVVGAGQLDLRSPPNPDQLDALTGVDPGPCLDRVPPRREKEREDAPAVGQQIARCIERHNAERAKPRK